MTAAPDAATADAAPPDLAMRDLSAGPCGPCAPPTPICDPTARRCVACLADPDCPAAQLCKSRTCMAGCSPARPQCGDAGACDVDLGICRGCRSDVDCRDPAPFCDLASGLCGTCTPQNDKCSDGKYCGLVNGNNGCIAGCKRDLDCPVGDGGIAPACCNHACVDTTRSAAHCGGCNQACAKGVCCGGSCADTLGDAMNCGGCGKVCNVPNTLQACLGGVCKTMGCLMGFADCDQMAANGCEAGVASDARNCGGCGKVCSVPNAVPLCVGGGCEISACQPGFRNCNARSADGCEVDAQSDPLNCGVCGQSCAKVANALAGCKSGMCVIASCSNGFGDCNKVADDGCESKLDADAMNCGGCGMVCPTPPNVLAACKQSLCGIVGCAPGFADCDQMAPNGCEIRTDTDAKNCGGCGKACPALPNALSGCGGGICAVGPCLAGFGDCDKLANNGCELSLLADNANCGGCGVACMMGKACKAGVCTGGGVLLGRLGNQNFYKVQAMGAMTDTNVRTACLGVGLGVGCQAMGNCNYNDNLCVMTQEASCGNPMQTLSMAICGGKQPSQCPALDGVYQYMGQKWTNGSACGVENASWCSQGSNFQNRFALCVE